MKQAWVSAPEKREEIADEGYSGLGGGVQMPGLVISTPGSVMRSPCEEIRRPTVPKVQDDGVLPVRLIDRIGEWSANDVDGCHSYIEKPVSRPQACD
jgi:hypothetical protein